MEDDLKSMQSQIFELYKALDQISNVAIKINDRLTVQEKKIDVILSKLDRFDELLEPSRDKDLSLHGKSCPRKTILKTTDISHQTSDHNKPSNIETEESGLEDNVSESQHLKKNQNVVFSDQTQVVSDYLAGDADESKKLSSTSNRSFTTCAVKKAEKVTPHEIAKKLTSSKSSPAISSNIFFGKALQEQGTLVKDGIAASPLCGDSKPESANNSSPGNLGNAAASRSDISDVTQAQNCNRVTKKTFPDFECSKTLKSSSSQSEGVETICDVIITNEKEQLSGGAEQDKKSANNHIQLENKSSLNVLSEENRRASYAGMTVKQKDALNISDMAPTNTNAERQRSNSSCELRHDVVSSKCQDKRIFDVKRQFSNTSTSSANSGIDLTLGADSDSDDDDMEIKLPEPPTPSFAHRVVTVKNSTYKHFYDLKDPIGGGRFGRVYHCVEKKTGLQLAAKCFQCKKPVAKTLLKSKSLKRAQNLKTKRTQQEPVEKDDVMMEIAIMNQIDHKNIVKLYDAYENDNTMTLILEYLGGGELFERVLADHQQLTELDAVLFMKQIVTAVQYLHKNHILHLDLKPENILCLDRSTHFIKIIDFGLARKYIPRQKLIVQWGTPEFMAPEMLNYEVVSFPSDMWSVGIICYILLSGMSPFLGEDDTETMANIVDCDWDFDEPPFKTVSDDARDFISRLLVEEKSGRMSAAQCLRHDWLATPLTGKRQKALLNKSELKHFMARMQWKASIAAVSAANWLKMKVTNVAENVMSLDTPV